MQFVSCPKIELSECNFFNSMLTQQINKVLVFYFFISKLLERNYLSPEVSLLFDKIMVSVNGLFIILETPAD